MNSPLPCHYDSFAEGAEISERRVIPAFVYMRLQRKAQYDITMSRLPLAWVLTGCGIINYLNSYQLDKSRLRDIIKVRLCE